MHPGHLLGLLLLTAAPISAAPVNPVEPVEPPGLDAQFRRPAGLQCKYLRQADRVSLRECSLEVPGAGRRAVVLTGYAEHVEKYFELIAELAARQWSVSVVEWRGFGVSGRNETDSQRVHVGDFVVYASDLEHVLSEVAPARRAERRVLIGHSLGGHLALRYLEEHPDAFDAAVLAAPGLGFGPPDRVPQWLLRTTIRVHLWLGDATAYASDQHEWVDEASSTDGLSHDAVRAQVERAWYRADPQLRVGGPTWGWMAAFLESCDRVTSPERLKRVRIPVLMGVPLADPVVQPAASIAACRTMRSCRALEFPGAWHELFMETDQYRDPWLDAMRLFMDGIAPPGR